MAASDIILGDGVFFINNVAAGLTRGGGQFVVEREYRQIEADGDFGMVKGRIRKIGSTAKLTLNALELNLTNLFSFYPAANGTNSGATGTITSWSDIDNGSVPGDFWTVKWVGTTKSGTGVSIILYNAINLENIDWSMVDKEEIVASVTYTATYLEASRNNEPWIVDFA
jgi:hypothetical protein